MTLKKNLTSKVNVAVVSSMFVFSTALPLFATPFTITINDANSCQDSWQITDSVTNLTVTCDGQSPPPVVKCPLWTTVNLGDLHFDGTQIDSSEMRGSAVAYGKIVIPNPLPDGWIGKTTSVSVFENGDGAYWRKVYLAKSPCDFSPTGAQSGQGVGVSLYMTFGGVGEFVSVPVMPGDIWYLNVKNETPNGKNSCIAGLTCNFGVRMYPPNN